MNHLSNDAGIPVLTEVIDTQKPSPAPLASNVAPADGTPMEDDPAWERIERDVRERVLQQLIDRIDFVLEQRVRDSLADVLQTAIEDLAREIRDGLHHTLKDVVTRAVTQELSKLQTGRRS